MRSRSFAEAVGALAKNSRAAAITARTAILNQLGAIKTTRLASERKRQLRAVDTGSVCLLRGA